MNTTRKNHSRNGFTLIEIMVSMAIFGLVMAAIYSTWSAVVKASVTCQNVTAQVQRERIAGRVLEESLSCTTGFASDPRHYSFVFENGAKPVLSFVARLPKSFPRSGKYGDFDTRRLSFTVEDGVLLLRQNPIIMDMDEDETQHPLELARNVKSFEIEALNPQTSQWSDTWLQTNLIPKMITVTVLFEPDNSGAKKVEGFQRVVALPAIMVQSSWQKPSLRGGGGGGGGNPGGNPGGGAQPQ